MGVFECLSCFGSRRTKVIQATTPLSQDLPSKSALSTVNSFDTECEHIRSQINGSTPSQEIQDPPRIAKSNRALIVSAKHTYALVDDHPFPSLHTDDEIIISTRAVGLNPIDWKSVDYNFCLPAFPWVTGREMAGVVEAVGLNVKDFKVGDRVWTSTFASFSIRGKRDVKFHRHILQRLSRWLLSTLCRSPPAHRLSYSRKPLLRIRSVSWSCGSYCRHDSLEMALYITESGNFTHHKSDTPSRIPVDLGRVISNEPIRHPDRLQKRCKSHRCRLIKDEVSC